MNKDKEERCDLLELLLDENENATNEFQEEKSFFMMTKLNNFLSDIRLLIIDAIEETPL
jgi:hypothetical protein